MFWMNALLTGALAAAPRAHGGAHGAPPRFPRRRTRGCSAIAAEEARPGDHARPHAEQTRGLPRSKRGQHMHAAQRCPPETELRRWHSLQHYLMSRRFADRLVESESAVLRRIHGPSRTTRAGSGPPQHGPAINACCNERAPSCGVAWRLRDAAEHPPRQCPPGGTRSTRPGCEGHRAVIPNFAGCSDTS